MPGVYELQLVGFAPNPTTTRDVKVSFTLPKQASGALSLYDVAGREMAREDLSSLGAGRHTLSVSADAHLAAGVYWLRLTHGGKSLTRRGVIVR